MKDNDKIKEAIKQSRNIDVEIIDKDGNFEFKCNKCGKCCTSSTVDSILLRPIDLYNLAKCFECTIDEIIETVTEQYIGPSSGFLMVKLKPIKDNIFSEIKCPYLKNNKCSVHEFKPSSCRLYPLGRIVSFNEEEDCEDTSYFIQKNTVCGGNGEFHTVDEWVKNSKEYEKALLVETNFIKEIDKYIHLNKIDIFKINSSIVSIVNKLMYTTLFYYYLNYDTDEDFLIQFKENTEKLKNIYIATAMTLYLGCIQNEFSQNTSEYMISNILGDEVLKLNKKTICEELTNILIQLNTLTT